MPTAAFPNPLLSGTVSSTTFKDFLVVAPASTPANTLEIVNGRLDADNISETVQREHCQRNSAVQIERRSGSISLDYFWDIWGGGNNSFGSNKAKAVPGLAMRFYMPWPGEVLLTWQFMWQGSLWSTGGNSTNWTTLLRFGTAGAVAGTPGTSVGPTRRRLEENIATDGGHDGVNSLRHYAGHWLAEPTAAGWYDAGIYLVPIQTEAVSTQTRFWCRNLVVAKFKRP